jgi:hypothetical protein
VQGVNLLQKSTPNSYGHATLCPCQGIGQSREYGKAPVSISRNVSKKSSPSRVGPVTKEGCFIIEQLLIVCLTIEQSWSNQLTVMSTAIVKPELGSGRMLPETEIATALQRWWHSEVGHIANDPFAPKEERKGTLYDVVVEIDSLSVIDALLLLEGIVGFEVPPKVIKRGGYRDCEEMVSHLLAGLRECAGRGTVSFRRKEKKYAI